jgi:DNA polymerase I-like protein with 3'-5' exonuclease and polymerase domains
MARVLNLITAPHQPDQIRRWAYNALDTIATRQIVDVLLPRMDEARSRYYRFSMAAQRPALACTETGLKVDIIKLMMRQEKVKEEIKNALKLCQTLAAPHWDGAEKNTGACRKATRKDGKHKWERGVADTPERRCVDCGASRFKPSAFNPGSDDQGKHLLYDILGCDELKNKQRIVSVDKDTLDRLLVKAPQHSEIILAIKEYRDLQKQQGFLNTSLTPECRYMSSFTIGVTLTGRQSSHDDPWHFGGNAQNISERHRDLFIPDDGYEFCYVDYKQGESKLVAYLAGDEAYIEAHELGDVHTYVTRILWPALPWTWDIEADKRLAKSTLAEWDKTPGHDLRFQSKRTTHGVNYGLSPFGVAMNMHIPVRIAKAAWYSYFGGFPRILGWQKHVNGLLKQRQAIVNPLGFKVRFYGSSHEDKDNARVLKQALAYLPQGLLGNVINIAEWLVWKNYVHPGTIKLSLQVHDALLFQFPKGRYDIARAVCKLLRVPIKITDYSGNTRECTIDVEAEVGMNWGHANAGNPDGLHPFDIDGEDE